MKSERIPVKSFSADNGFIGKMQKLVREEVLPYQYNILTPSRVSKRATPLKISALQLKS